jgi:hypothetical protein
MLRRAPIEEQKELQTKSKEYEKSSSTRTGGAPDQERRQKRRGEPVNPSSTHSFILSFII